MAVLSASDLSAGDTVLATQYNNLRNDVRRAGGGPLVDNVGGSAYHLPGWRGVVHSGTLTLAQHELYYIPIYCANALTVIRIGINVTTAQAATSARLGIYNATLDAEDHLTPDTLVLDAGTVSLASTGVKEITISQALTEGEFYFLAISADSSTAVVTATGSTPAPPVSLQGTNINGAPAGFAPTVTVADGAAALPSPATAPDAIVGGAPKVMIRE